MVWGIIFSGSSFIITLLELPGMIPIYRDWQVPLTLGFWEALQFLGNFQ